MFFSSRKMLTPLKTLWLESDFSNASSLRLRISEYPTERNGVRFKSLEGKKKKELLRKKINYSWFWNWMLNFCPKRSIRLRRVRLSSTWTLFYIFLSMKRWDFMKKKNFIGFKSFSSNEMMFSFHKFTFKVILCGS